ncbi:hypothetical protein QUD64_04810 [Lactococcus cremoris]|uniref:hypothetical protein n=1 Tax=Lactococcus lactis subsp. cremoris TaxID=1359 RepID=UPI0025A16334|nr:hypothetical protein [Lactococcus cremoris]MDM7653528.1 hypothetical protein [Lactococcus cremoris]
MSFKLSSYYYLFFSKLHEEGYVNLSPILDKYKEFPKKPKDIFKQFKYKSTDSTRYRMLRLNNEEIKSINYLLKNITSEQLISLLKIQVYKVDEINYLFNNISNIKLSGDNSFYLNENELESLDYLFEKISNLKPRPKNIGSFIKKIINIIKNNEEGERFYDHNSDYYEPEIITNMLHQENLTLKYDEYSHSSYRDILNNLEKKSTTPSDKNMSDFIILDYLSQNIENESITTFFQHIISTIERNYDSLIKIHHKSLFSRYAIPNNDNDFLLNDERKSIKFKLYDYKPELLVKFIGK